MLVKGATDSQPVEYDRPPSRDSAKYFDVDKNMHFKQVALKLGSRYWTFYVSKYLVA